MKKRPKRPFQPPTARTPLSMESERPPDSGSLQYKVVELSTVDEGTLEHTVNDWVGQGWNFEGVQFAMRESSKRPSMAFVFFTRHAERAEREATPAGAHLIEMAGERGRSRPVSSAFQRLRELSEDDSEST